MHCQMCGFCDCFLIMVKQEYIPVLRERPNYFHPHRALFNILLANLLHELLVALYNAKNLILNQAYTIYHNIEQG